MKKQSNRQKEPGTLGHKTMTIFGAILCIILIPILVINCTLIIRSYANQDKVPRFGSFVPMIVLTDSMYPKIRSGDLIIAKQANAEDVKEGDIILFYDPAGDGTATVTHRVAKVTKDDNGNLAFKTKGDANNTADQNLVPAENIIGIYCRRISSLGNVAMFMQTSRGLVVCVILPLIFLIGYDLIRRRINDKKHSKDTEVLQKELEELRKLKEQQGFSKISAEPVQQEGQ